MRTTIDLTDVQRQLVDDLLSTHVPRMEVWAFGSRVRWTSNTASDLDLVVFASPDQTHRLARLREAFDESGLPFRVDLHAWDNLPESFHDNIARDYLVLRSPSNDDLDSANVIMQVGDFMPFSYGRSLPSANRNPDGQIPVYGSNGVIGYHDTALTQGPTIIVGRKGTVGAVHYSSKPCWPIDTTFYIEGEDLELVRFKYYLLKSVGLDAMNSDSAIPGLNRDNAHTQEISVPPPATQRSVASILGSLDDKIDLNHQISRTLEDMAQAVFQSWFVDFDPVRAEADGRDPQLSAPFADIFHDPFIDSELGHVPAGWIQVSLPEAIDVNPPRDLRKGEVAPYLDMASMPTLSHVPRRIVRKPYGSGTRFLNGDTLVARITPCLENGKIAFVDFLQDGEIGWGSTEYIVMRPRPPLPLSYAYFLACTPDFREFAVKSMTGSSGRQRLPVQALSDFQVRMPPAQVARAFERVVTPLISRSTMVSRNARVLSRVRDSLIPQLIA